MGAPIATRLSAAGHDVVAWNRNPAKAARLERRGLRAEPDAALALAHAEVAIVMLSSGPVVDEVLFGRDARARALVPGATLVMMSSIPVATCRRQAAVLAQRGVAYVDAPVSGGERGAIEGRLAIMAGGSERDVDRVAGVLAPLGRLTRIGDVGSGQLAKLANQIIVGVTVAAVAEALHFASSGGADPAAVRVALAGGFAESVVLREHGRRMVERDYAPGGPATYQLKDLRTAREYAAGLGLDLPLLATAEALFAAMIEHGDGELDHSAVIREIARRGPVGQAAA
jgi:3-hydroxyisobutyrate dehydrogenase-like beta-hydroxyacid dehydrogenase